MIRLLLVHGILLGSVPAITLGGDQSGSGRELPLGRHHVEDCDVGRGLTRLSPATLRRATKFHFEVTEPYLAALRHAWETYSVVQRRPLVTPDGLSSVQSRAFLARDREDRLDARLRMESARSELDARYQSRLTAFLRTVPKAEETDAKYIASPVTCPPGPASSTP